MENGSDAYYDEVKRNYFLWKILEDYPKVELNKVALGSTNKR